jgi:hypothetical protein
MKRARPGRSVAARRPRRWVRPALVAQMVAILAIVLIGASVARSKQESQIGTTPLGVGTRDRLAICIQPAEGLTLGKDEAASAVQAAFPEVEMNPGWAVYAPYAVGGPQIDLGCPTVPAFFRPTDNSYPPSSPTSRPGRLAATVVQSPGPYRTYVIVLPDARLSAVLVSDLLGRRSAEEDMCGGASCAEVTSGIYISESEFRNPSRLAAALVVGLGISDTVVASPQPSPSPRVRRGIGAENYTPIPRTPKPSGTLTPKQKEFLELPR